MDEKYKVLRDLPKDADSKSIASAIHLSQMALNKLIINRFLENPKKHGYNVSFLIRCCGFEGSSLWHILLLFEKIEKVQQKALEFFKEKGITDFARVTMIDSLMGNAFTIEEKLMLMDLKSGRMMHVCDGFREGDDLEITCPADDHYYRVNYWFCRKGDAIRFADMVVSKASGSSGLSATVKDRESSVSNWSGYHISIRDKIYVADAEESCCRHEY